MAEITLEPVRHGVTVAIGPVEAFDLFTAGFDTWWPRDHHIGDEEMDRAVIEPRVGGRVYEVGVSGVECQWGEVLVWEPPERLVVAWQLNGQWQYDPDIAHASEYEVRFASRADGGTDVVLEHRHFERHGADGPIVHRGVGGPEGWRDLVGRYAAIATGGGGGSW